MADHNELDHLDRRISFAWQVVIEARCAAVANPNTARLDQAERCEYEMNELLDKRSRLTAARNIADNAVNA